MKNGTFEGKTLLERVGLTARDLIVIILIMVNMYLIASGHTALDGKLIQVEAQQARYCGVAGR